MPRGIGLVLLDYDQAATTRRCLRSVAAGTRRPDEIVLVENGGPPVDLASDEVLADLVVHVLRPERQHRSGECAQPRDSTIWSDNSDVERYVLLDNDTTVPGGFFELVAASSFERLEIAAPLILSMDTGEVIYAGGRFDRYRYPSVIPEWREVAARRTREVEWATDRRTGLRPRYLAPRRAGSMSWYRIECGRTSNGATGRCDWELLIRVEPQPAGHARGTSVERRSLQPRASCGSGRGTERFSCSKRWAGVRRLNWFAKEFRLIWGEVRAGWRPTAAGACCKASARVSGTSGAGGASALHADRGA